MAHAAVVERHRGTGRIGLGYATGFGLRRGAMASTVAHDAHNCVAVGARDTGGPDDMAVAVARLAELGGGQVAVLDRRVVGEVPLPLAGLMSDRPAGEVATQIHELNRMAADTLGVTIEEPFMQLSFLALSVIPELRLTDGGLVDVGEFAYVPVEAAGPTPASVVITAEGVRVRAPPSRVPTRPPGPWGSLALWPAARRDREVGSPAGAVEDPASKRWGRRCRAWRSP